MERLIPVKTYLHSMEAELAKNALEAGGIEAMLTADNAGGTRPDLAFGKGIHLVVREEDAARAREILEEDEDCDGEPEPGEREAFERQREEQEAAAREFRQIERNTLKEKEKTVESSLVWGAVFLAGGLALLLLGRGAYLASRGGMVLLLLAVIQVFVWQDALRARRQLKREQSKEGKS